MNNVITAKFSKGVYSTTAKVFRYDVGDKLQFVGLDLPDNYRVDFSNSVLGESKTVFCTSDTVEIPPEYFIPGSTIYAWIVLSQDNGRYTKYQVNIPISARAKPLDIDPTPAQKDALDEAIEALNNVTEDIQGQIDSALEEAKASGEFDGTTIWLYDGTPVLPDYTFYKYLMRANANAVVRQFDFILLGSILYQIISVSEFTCRAIKFVDLKGAPGQNPIVSVRRNDQDYSQIIVDTPDGLQVYDIDNLLTVYFSLGDHWAIYDSPGFTKLGEALRRKCAVLAVVDLPPSEEYGGFRDERASIIAPLTYWKVPKNESIADNEDLWEFEFKGKTDETHALRIYKNAGVNSKWRFEIHQDDGLTGYQMEQVESIVMGFSGLFLGNYANKATVDSISWVFNNMPAEELDPLPEGSKYVSERDYIVIQDDETQNHECWRYVWNTYSRSFIPQYRINESPMTNAQLAALNSGITSELVAQIGMPGAYDYSDLSNKPQINSVTLSGDKSLSDLGIEAEAFVVAITESDGTYTADKTASQILEASAAKKRVVATLGATIFQYFAQIGGKAYFTAIYNNTSRLLAVAETKVATVSIITLGTYNKPTSGIPKTDLASDVQTLLSKAGTALQAHQDISGKVDKNQGSANAGKVLTVGSDGNVAPQDAVSSDNVFFAAYGTTTSAEIDAAVQAGKAVYCIYDNDGENDILPLVGVESSEDHSFGCVYSGSVLLANCNSDQWQYSSFVIGTYTKPSGGIPKTDLASEVQTLLGKADTALQQHQSLSGYATETWVQQQGYLTQHQDISGKLDKNQGTAHAGEFLVVGSDGNVTTQAVEENNSLAAFATDTASGAIASFTDGADDIPVKDLTIAIEPVQAGSGDPSSSNVRPISGWTAANVTRAGKNLFDKNDPDVTHGYAVSATGGNLYTASSGIWAASGFMPVNGGNQYIILRDTAAGDLAFYDANKVFISGVSDGSRAVMAPANARYARIDYTVANEDRIQFGQAYQVENYAITFPTEAGTVYGGTLDVTTGKLTVTHGQIASYAGESLSGEWISDRDVYAAGTAPTTGAQVVYELAEPVEYDLTPTEVNTLLGENNIWADCGDSTVEYRADTKLYVDKKIAAIPSVPMWNGGSY